MKTNTAGMLLAATLGVMLLFPAPSHAETWLPFASLIDDSDYVAQYQERLRDGQFVGRRLVHIYWATKDSKAVDVAASSLKLRPWTSADYQPGTDKLVTTFVFYGRGQHLWTVSPHNDLIEYPGSTAELDFVSKELTCSPTEFDSILQDAAKLKQAGTSAKGALTVSVFGKETKLK